MKTKVVEIKYWCIYENNDNNDKLNPLRSHILNTSEVTCFTLCLIVSNYLNNRCLNLVNFMLLFVLCPVFWAWTFKVCHPVYDLNCRNCSIFLPVSSSFCLVSHETCLLDQVLELIMNEKPPTSASLFLNEDTDKPPLPERGNLRWRLLRAMEKRASNMKERMNSVSRSSVKGFLKRNLFVLFTVAAVALGEWRACGSFKSSFVKQLDFI